METEMGLEMELKHTFVIRTDDENFEQALHTFLSNHCTKESKFNAACYGLNEAGADKVMAIINEE